MVDSAADEDNTVEAAHLVTALVSILTPQDELSSFPGHVVQKLLGIRYVFLTHKWQFFHLTKMKWIHKCRTSCNFLDGPEQTLNTAVQ